LKKHNTAPKPNNCRLRLNFDGSLKSSLLNIILIL
jgi:hypothetical protein